MYRFTYHTFFIFLFSSLAFSIAHSKETKKKKKAKDVFIEQNKRISEELDKAASNIDWFLTFGKDTEKENKTTFTIENEFNRIEGESFAYNPHLDIDLHLPRLEDTLKIEFSTYDVEDEERGINRNRLQIDEKEERYSTGLVLLDRVGDINTRFRPRLDFEGELNTSHILTFTSDIPLSGEYFLFRPALELFARSDTGTGQFFALNFQYIFSEKLSLGLLNEEQYTSVDHVFTVTHGIRFLYVYSDRFYQDLGFNMEYNKDPNYHLSRYTVSSTFTQEILKQVVHYELTPYMLFEEERSFSGRAGLKLNIQLIF